MTTEPLQEMRPQPPAPPTAPVPIIWPVPESKWPLVIGIIAIVFAVGAILGAIWGIANLLLLGDFGFGPTTPLSEMRNRMLVVNGVQGCVAPLLLAAGIGLVRHRRWAVNLARVWALLKILIALFGLVFTYEMVTGFTRGMPRGASALAVFSSVVGLLWLWALPVFMLIWFSRGPVRRKVEQWA